MKSHTYRCQCGSCSGGELQRLRRLNGELEVAICVAVARLMSGSTMNSTRD